MFSRKCIARRSYWRRPDTTYRRSISYASVLLGHGAGAARGGPPSKLARQLRRHVRAAALPEPFQYHSRIGRPSIQYRSMASRLSPFVSGTSRYAKNQLPTLRRA